MLKFLFLLLSFTVLSNPLDEVHVKLADNIIEEHEDESFKFIFNGSYFSVSNAELGTNLGGAGIAFQALYMLSNKFAIGGGAGTTMSQGGAGAATILNWAFTYSLTGALKSTKSEYSLNGKEILSGLNSISEGLRVQMVLSQYYFNATNNTIPYAGFGGAIYYDKYIDYIGSNAVLGLRVEQLYNNELTLTPITLMFGILI